MGGGQVREENSPPTPLVIHSINPLVHDQYTKYVESHGCRLEKTENGYLLHLPDGAVCTTTGPYDRCMVTRVELPQGEITHYKQLHRDGTSWCMIHIPEELAWWV